MKYLTKKCSSLSNIEIKQCSKLFSNNYGNYSIHSPIRPGEKIKLGVNSYNRLRDNENTYVSLAYNGDNLVGQAFYVLEKDNKNYISWVIQLVVDKDFRRQSIAKKLLFSIWGFSNDIAWGLATPNPLTVKALESATLRKVSLKSMKKNIALIKKLGEKIEFIKNEKINISDKNATVDTEFYVDHGSILENINSYGGGWPYGNLEEGKEWLAFVFQEQEITNLTSENLERLIDGSEKSLIDAYSRMQIEDHPWAGGTKNEVDFITNYFTQKEKPVIDFGCGVGRHIFDLYSRGYKNIFGIDFSENHINHCKEKKVELKDLFQVSDCRFFSSEETFEYALCLYDVIGSFPNNNENKKILKQLHRSLNQGGIAIISVMNMELTQKIVNNVTNIYENPESLFKLKSSNTMQSSGNIFNPEYLIIDKHSGNVFRKEKFTNDGGLSAEYIVRDRRYTRKEIEEMAQEVGFEIIESRFVRAGDWSTSRKNIDPKAKEILLVLKKSKNNAIR